MSKVDAKVVILGKSCVGKTSLVCRYIDSRFDPNLPYQNTIGAAFGSKKEIVNGKALNLGIWDTAGHERYESMTRMYYRGSVAAILCYDITDKTSFDRTRFWAGELRATEPKCKLYLCGTKKDVADHDPTKRAVDRKMAEPLAADFQTDLFETSSLTGENIDVLFRKIANDIIEQRESNEREHKVLQQQNSRRLHDIQQQTGWHQGCVTSLSKC